MVRIIEHVGQGTTIEREAGEQPSSTPTVIRDKRPTREQVEAAMVDGAPYLKRSVATFLRAYRGGVSLFVFSESFGLFVAHDVYNNAVIADGAPAPGETWRPVGPDGEPLRLNLPKSP